MSGLDVATNGGEPMVLPQERHDANGHPYMSLYFPESVLGFTWDGDIDQPVQVTREPGEAVIATFYMPDVTFRDSHTATGWLALFRQACERFERDFEDFEEPPLPEPEYHLGGMDSDAHFERFGRPAFPNEY